MDTSKEEAKTHAAQDKVIIGPRGGKLNLNLFSPFKTWSVITKINIIFCWKC